MVYRNCRSYQLDQTLKDNTMEQKSAPEMLQAYDSLLRTVEAARACGVSEEKMLRKLVAMIIWNMDDLPSDVFDKQHEFNMKYLGRIQLG
jgi:molecular chaperone GrpE (heat shock protein)